MKKGLLLSSLLLPIFLLSSCNTPTNGERLYFPYGNTQTENWISMDKEEWKELRTAQGSYIVYAYVSGCLTCHDIVEPRLQHLINTYGIPIYRVNYSTLDSSDPLKAGFEAGPSIGFYKDGKKIKVTNYLKNEKVFSNDTAFFNFVEQYIVLPKAFYLSLDDIKKKQQEKETFYLLFTRSSCSDCSSLFQHVLTPYLWDHSVENLYLLECDVEGIRLQNGEFSEENWSNFKKEWNLTSSSSYGYLSGVVPTIQQYQNGELHRSAVYLNDEYAIDHKIGAQEGEHISVTLTITTSFYQEFVGKTHTFSLDYYESSFATETYTEYRSWARDAYHKDAFLSFLTA